MTTLHIQGDWIIIQGPPKQKWAMLADDDLRSTEGAQSELLLHMSTPAGERREAGVPATPSTVSGGIS